MQPFTFLFALAALCLGMSNSTAQPLRINEVLANPPGSDTGNEYFELFGAPNLDFQSFVGGGQSLWFLVIESDGDITNDGVVEFAVELTGAALPANQRSLGSNGLFLFSTGAAFLPAPAAGTNTRTSATATNIDNEANTYLLVRSFTGTIGTDLDVGDTGVLDTSFWSEVYDAVTVLTEGLGMTYANQFGGVTLVGPNTAPDSFTPDLIFRVQNTGQWAAADLLGTLPGPLNIDPAEFFFAGSTSLDDPSVLSSQQWSPGNFNPTVAVPEPATLLLCGLGMVGGLASYRRLKKTRRRA